MIGVPVISTVPMSPSAPFSGVATEKARPHEERGNNESLPGTFCPGEVRLLILDDDESSCRLIQAAFSSRSFKVDIVRNPSLVENALRTQIYHIIILDYVLPGLEGKQVLDWLRETQPDAGVIVVTAHPSVESVLSSFHASTFDYLAKPFHLSDIQRLVHRCLERRGLLRLSEEALRESLGTIIRERRKGLGLTLAQMAQRTGVSLGYLSQIELGRNSASLETLYRISLGLGLKMADLFQSVPSRNSLLGAFAEPGSVIR